MNPFVQVKIYQTQGIATLVKAEEQFKTELIIALGRFFHQDWGDVCDDDKEPNAYALPNKQFILAAYETSQGLIWITAGSENSQQYNIITLLLPDEY